MKNFLNVLGIFVFVAIFSLLSCKGSGGGGKGYLSVNVFDDNSVVVNVYVPEHHYGYLSLNGEPTVEVLVASGPVELGVLDAGDYTVCIEFFVSPEGQALLDDYYSNRKRNRLFSPPFKDITGRTECCDFVAFPLDGEDPPDDPGPPDPPNNNKPPKLITRVNYDGTVLIIVVLGSEPSALLQKIGENEQLFVDRNLHHVVEDLECGDHGYVLLDTNTEDEFDRSVFNIPCVPNDDPGDPELPPKPEDPRTRFLVCHNEHQLLIPWNALKAHLLIHGDKLGLCDDDGDDDD